METGTTVTLKQLILLQCENQFITKICSTYPNVQSCAKWESNIQNCLDKQ